MPLYGCQLWDISSKHVEKCYVTWRKCIRRCLDLPHSTHYNLLHLICNDLRPETQIHSRLCNFIYNSCVNLSINLAFNNSDSSVSNSINCICNKYNLQKDSLKIINCKEFLTNYDITNNETNNLRIAQQIKELIQDR